MDLRTVACSLEHRETSLDGQLSLPPVLGHGQIKGVPTMRKHVSCVVP